MLNLKTFFSDLKEITVNTAKEWAKADPFRQSAVVAYYAIFSIPALIVIVIALAGLAFGKEAIQGEISTQISNVIDKETAKQLEEIVANSSKKDASIIATLISVITLILGSTGVFVQLQNSLNQIWNVKITAKKKWLKTIKDRLLSFGLVLSICFLMLVSLLLTAGLEAFSGWIKNHLPDFILYVFEFLNFVISFGVISALYIMIFKILPDVKIQWRDVWIGGVVTTLLFILGKTGMGIYFAKASPGSAYGAAGSIVLVMLWVSYSCMILFFGAEFTKQFATHYGRGIQPTEDSQLITETEKEKKK